jgi:hypothetical protein
MPSSNLLITVNVNNAPSCGDFSSRLFIKFFRFSQLNVDFDRPVLAGCGRLPKHIILIIRNRSVFLQEECQRDKGRGVAGASSWWWVSPGRVAGICGAGVSGAAEAGADAAVGVVVPATMR